MRNLWNWACNLKTRVYTTFVGLKRVNPDEERKDKTMTCFLVIQLILGAAGLGAAGCLVAEMVVGFLWNRKMNRLQREVDAARKAARS